MFVFPRKDSFDFWIKSSNELYFAAFGNLFSIISITYYNIYITSKLPLQIVETKLDSQLTMTMVMLVSLVTPVSIVTMVSLVTMVSMVTMVFLVT